MLAWRIGESFNPTDPAKGFEEALTEDNFLYDFYYLGLRVGRLPTPWLPFRPLTEKDLQWRPSDWRPEPTYSRWPVVMRICLYPRGDRERGEAPPSAEKASASSTKSVQSPNSTLAQKINIGHCSAALALV